MEKEIKITAKLYQARDAVKSLAKLRGDKYPDILKDYIEIIDMVMKKENLNHLQAYLRVSGTKTFNHSEWHQLLFTASLVEMMEPSKENIQ